MEEVTVDVAKKDEDLIKKHEDVIKKDEDAIEAKITRAYLAVYALQKNKIIPDRQTHISRNDYNCFPIFELKRLPDTYAISGKKFKYVYHDAVTDSYWIMEPWYLSIFHKPWKNYKFVCFDNDIIPGATGSSEIIVPKTAALSPEENEFNVTEIQQGSYNFRTNGVAHFFADILPNVLYFKIVGN
jgi:hypothetical protein